METSAQRVEPFVHETLIRPATEADWPFITSSWLRSYRHSQFASHIPPAVYFRHHHGIIDRIKARGAQFLVLGMADNPEVVLGFACIEGSSLHYVYVKLSFRRIRLASTLVGDRDIRIVTHLTKVGAAFKAKNLPHATYNPYAV